MLTYEFKGGDKCLPAHGHRKGFLGGRAVGQREAERNALLRNRLLSQRGEESGQSVSVPTRIIGWEKAVADQQGLRAETPLPPHGRQCGNFLHRSPEIRSNEDVRAVPAVV